MVSPNLPWNGPILNLPARIDGAEMRFLHQCLACPQVNVGSAVDEVVNATHSVLMAQVRHADASHKIDTAHQLLRGKHYSGPSRVVYLGDVAKAILAQLAHPDTPVFTQAPGYNEQRWTLVTNSGDLRAEIQSLPYWGWGLVTLGLPERDTPWWTAGRASSPGARHLQRSRPIAVGNGSPERG